MPLYDFHCKACHKTVEVFKKIDSKDEVLTEPCPNCGVTGLMEQALSAPALIDPFRVGRMPTNSQLRDRFKQIHQDNPGSTLDKTSNLTKI